MLLETALKVKQMHIDSIRCQTVRFLTGSRRYLSQYESQTIFINIEKLLSKCKWFIYFTRLKQQCVYSRCVSNPVQFALLLLF